MRTFQTAVDIAVATYRAFPESSDADIEAMLEHHGVEPWLAERLVLFLPIAFGRVLLQDARLPSTYFDGKTERPLAEDPIFTTAVQRAADATKEEIQIIGYRSSEISAANQALQAGSELKDLLFSPFFSPPLAPLQESDGGLPAPSDIFAQMLQEHGQSVTWNEGYNTGEMKFGTSIYVQRCTKDRLVLQIDFVVEHPALASGWLKEGFAGFGAKWKDAIAQAVQKFERGSFHVLLAALLDRNAAPNQVSWEPLEHPDGAFELCLGGQMTLYAGEPRADLNTLLNSFKSELQKMPLARKAHGLRLFVFFDGPKMTANEVLLDNEYWEPGRDLVAHYAWPPVQDMWATRLFAMIVPVSTVSDT